MILSIFNLVRISSGSSISYNGKAIFSLLLFSEVFSFMDNRYVEEPLFCVNLDFLKKITKATCKYFDILLISLRNCIEKCTTHSQICYFKDKTHISINSYFLIMLTNKNVGYLPGSLEFRASVLNRGPT